MKNLLPPPELQIILAHILQKSREYVLTHPEIALNKAQKAKFRKLVNRRKNHEPLAYILGHKEFYGLDFNVNGNVLIPRPETELLVEEVIKKIQATGYKTPYTIIDIGTGSGNIIISIAKNIKNKNNYFGIDISQKALQIAKYNAKKNKVDKKIKFINSDLLDFLVQNTKYKIQNTILIANLPYLSKKIYHRTPPDVKNFEPKSALLSGQDGLDHYETLFKQIKKIPNTKYHILNTILEISPEQKTKIEKIVKKYFPSGKIIFKKDLAGKWRVAMLDI